MPCRHSHHVFRRPALLLAGNAGERPPCRGDRIAAIRAVDLARVERRPRCARRVPRRCAEALAKAFESLWQDIKSGRVHPARLQTLIEPYSVETQFGRLFAMGFKRRMYCNRNCIGITAPEA